MTMTLGRSVLNGTARGGSPESYMVGGESTSADWRWPDGTPRWRMSDKEGIEWTDNGPLNEVGRQMLLSHFGLESIAAHLPLEILTAMSPATLLKKRRTLEKHGLERLEPVSTRPGAHIPASLAA